MLELRLIADAKQIASMRDAIRRECERMNTGPDHAEMVGSVAEELVVRPRRSRTPKVFVIVTVQSDATMLMVREPGPDRAELSDRRRQVLQECTERWTTMCGRDGRTIWAEIARTSRREPVSAPTAVVPRTSAWPRGARVAGAPRGLPCAP